MKKKSIFIYATDGFNDRVIIKSDLLNRLKKNIDRIIIFYHDADNPLYKKQFEDEGVEVGDIDVIFSVKDHLAHLEILVEKDGKILFCNKDLDTTKDRFK